MLRCVHCGEVIGVYEPLIEVSEGRVAETSRAVDPQLCEGAGEHYHRECFERRDEPRPPAG